MEQVLWSSGCVLIWKIKESFTEWGLRWGMKDNNSGLKNTSSKLKQQYGCGV